MYPNNEFNWTNYPNTEFTPNLEANYSNLPHSAPQDGAQAPTKQYFENPYYHQNRIGYPDDVHSYQNLNAANYDAVTFPQNSEFHNDVYKEQHNLQNPGTQNFQNSQGHQNPEGQGHVYNGQQQSIQNSGNVHQNQVLDPNSISLYPDSGFPRHGDDEIPKTADFFTYNDDDVRYSGVQGRIKYDSSDSESDSEDRDILRNDSQKIQRSDALLKVQRIESSNSEVSDIYRKKLHKSHFVDSDSKSDDVNSNKIQKHGESSRVQESFISESGDSDFPEYIDTKQLGLDISAELKKHGIPQTIFAKQVICRSQGTLSELLMKPKKWENMKMCGQSTYVKLWNWLQQPLETRLEILNKGEEENGSKKRRNSTSTNAPAPKRSRLTFTDFQKKTLNAIFKEEQNPSKIMIEGIAAHLKLEVSTVYNWFMNTRRRERHAE